MNSDNSFDVIIIGGSYAGLAAAMALGRALKKVMIIDNGKPCNRQTPHSHNFITNDGKKPAEIAAIANLQVRRYKTIQFLNALATGAAKTETGFEIQTSAGKKFSATKLIFATGIKDIFPEIKGIESCWGISVIHCPYCHGYEVRNEKTAILANGNIAFDFVRLISNWTKDITLFTNGASGLTTEQTQELQQHKINIIQTQIESLEHTNGHLQNIIFKDGSKYSINVIYAPLPFEQHCKIPAALGCELTDDGYIKIDSFHETTIAGVFACGDNVTRMRTLANAVAMGTTTGITVSKKLILEEF